MKLGVRIIKVLRLVAVAAVVGVPFALKAQTDIAKMHAYLQTAAGVGQPDPNDPFYGAIYSVSSATVTEPNGQMLSLTYDTGSLNYEYQYGAKTQAALDQALPDGTYLFGPGVSIDLAGDQYPPTPLIENGTWNAFGQLVIDNSKVVNLLFSSFPGYDSPGASGQVTLLITDPDTFLSVYTKEWESTTTPAAPTGVILYPASYQLTPGKIYFGSLLYGRNTLTSPTASAGYFSYTNFTVLAAGPVSTTPPEILTQPVSATVAVASSASFRCTASGFATYQWNLNGAPLFRATDPILIVPDAQASNVGSYTCTATNSLGSVTSNGANLTVVPTTNAGRLVNISCRASVGSGADILIAGFVVGGAGTSGSEPLLVRGSGPALTPFGLAGVLPDPELELFAGASLLNANAGWAGSAVIMGAAASVGAFPWTDPTSHDAALLQSLPVGAYTAHLSGQSADSGVGLVEVYDATPIGTSTPTQPRLINLSARVQVGQGSNILIAGFAIAGNTSRTVLIRGSGPALAPLGVTGSLPDPKLQLFAGTELLATNQGWAGDQTIAATAAEVGAFAWTDLAGADSALIATLPPGSYTAQISGASNDTGVALVEIYAVP